MFELVDLNALSEMTSNNLYLVIGRRKVGVELNLNRRKMLASG